MKISRSQAKNLKVGDIVQQNVSSAKNLSPTWYQVNAVKTVGDKAVLTVEKVRINQPSGLKTKMDQIFEERMGARTVLVKLV